jgi:HSP20 family protein
MDMTLVSWNPIREFEDVFGRYDRLLSALLPTATEGDTKNAAQWRPAANIVETDQEYLIKAELPEVDKKDVEVTVHEGVITIRGERKYERSHESEKQHRVETAYGSFARSFNLPADVDEKRIVAESKDGVLKVHLPKLEIQKPKAIEIQVK